MTDQDSPWKEMLEGNLGVALEFFFPEIHIEIDWGQEHEILRQELPPVAPPGEKRIADLVAKGISTHGDERYLHGRGPGRRGAGLRASHPGLQPPSLGQVQPARRQLRHPDRC